MLLFLSVPPLPRAASRHAGSLVRRPLNALFLIVSLLVSPLTIQPVSAEALRDQRIADKDIQWLEPKSVKPRTLVSGLEHPWGMAFIDTEHILVSERSGRLRVISRLANDQYGISPPVSGLPEIVSGGQAGLLDVEVHKGRIWFSYSEPGPLLTNSTAVMSAILRQDDGGRYHLSDQRLVFSQYPKILSTAHFGSRLVFDNQDHLFITLGERYIARDDAQRLNNDHGKLVRLNDDGSIPDDNPFVKRDNARPEIWSYGHRNMQGAAINPWSGQLWTHEHGPKGGDEINIPQPGRNYGWPLATWGKEYSGGDIGEGPRKAGTEQPLYYWLPSIAPSGMAFYTGDRYPDWQHSLFVGSLKFRTLVRLQLDGDRITAEERLYSRTIRERIRDVIQGPDGLLYLLTDEDNGKLIRLEPGLFSR